MDEPTDYQRLLALLIAADLMGREPFAGQTTLQRAKWLMSLGMSRQDAATVLGSTSDSIRVMLASETKKSATTPTPAKPSPIG